MLRNMSIRIAHVPIVKIFLSLRSSLSKYCVCAETWDSRSERVVARGGRGEVFEPIVSGFIKLVGREGRVNGEGRD